MTFAWMYFLDVVGAPWIISAFGAGCMSSSLLVLAVVKWFVPWYERASGLVSTSPVRVLDPVWEGPMLGNRWVSVSHYSPAEPFRVSVVDEDAHATHTAALTARTTRSLADWLNEQLKGVRP